MNRIKVILLLGLVSCLIGCSTWVVLRDGTHEWKDLGFKSTTPHDWMAYKPANGILLTKDGSSLNHIGVKKIKFLQRLANTNKRFQKGMFLPEILEIEIDSIKSNKEIYFFNIIRNEPITIDGLEAYRLEYEYEEQNGLKVKAIQCGFIYHNFVYRIVFKAAKLHYYEATVEDFESFFKSFQLL